MKVKLTCDHIRRAMPGNAQRCPVALALTDSDYRIAGAFVTHDSIAVHVVDRTIENDHIASTKSFTMERNLADRVIQFDRAGIMQAGEIHLDWRNGVARYTALNRAELWESQDSQPSSDG